MCEEESDAGLLNNRKQQSPQTHTHTQTGARAHVCRHTHARTQMRTSTCTQMRVCTRMHTDTRLSGRAHSRTYSCVRVYTHRGLHTLPFPILASNSMQPPSAPSSPSSPDLSPPTPEAPGSAQTQREHAHTCILHQNTLLGKCFCRGKPMEAPHFLSS